jgi:hypothetical protein
MKDGDNSDDPAGAEIRDVPEWIVHSVSLSLLIASVFAVFVFVWRTSQCPENEF